MIHSLEIKMYYEDTDAGGVIYYANHVKYMERGRTEFLSTLGISLPRLMDHGSLFTVTDLELHYRSYAQYGDVLVVETRLKELAAAFLIIEHRMKEKNSGRAGSRPNLNMRKGGLAVLLALLCQFDLAHA